MTKTEALALGWGDRAEAFTSWYNEVNHACIRISTLGTADIPDFDYASAFNAGQSSEETAKEALLAADFPEDLLD